MVVAGDVDGSIVNGGGGNARAVMAAADIQAVPKLGR
jgi:hypothetical protein